MAALRRFFLRLLNAARPVHAEDELARELTSHLGLLAEDFERQGMSPDEARRAARRALTVERTKDAQRDQRSFAWIDDARRDAGYAVRLLRRSPILTAAAVASLAIGIGANTAVFTVGNALLLRGAEGVHEPDRLVEIGMLRGDGGFNPISYAAFTAIRERSTTLEGVYAQRMFPQAVNLDTSGAGASGEPAFGHMVSTSYFTVLGVKPRAGRLFGPADSDRVGDSPIVVLSERFWERRFARDPSAIGRAVSLNGKPVTIVGVAPATFHGTGITECDFWLPLSIGPAINVIGQKAFTGDGNWLTVGGRLRDGVQLEQAGAEVAAMDVFPHDGQVSRPGAERRLVLLASTRAGGNRNVFAMLSAVLFALVSLILLVACANVSGLLLARATARRREMSVRISIGAGRSRLLRQLLIETGVLFVCGGAAGVVLAKVTTAALAASLPALPFPVSLGLPIDLRVIAFTAGLSLVTALAFGLAPALQASRTDPIGALKEGAPGVSGRGRLRHVFVVAQVALSVLIVVTAGLFVRALVRAGSINPGYDPRGVELASIDLKMGTYADAAMQPFWDDLIVRLEQLPGVDAVTLSRVAPGGFEGIGLGIGVPGVADHFELSGNIVAPGYFTTLRIPLIAGRDFAAGDRQGTQPVVIIDEAAAKHYWDGPVDQALGKYMVQNGPQGPQQLLVVGVVATIKSSTLIDGFAQSFVYLPLAQQRRSDLTTTMTIVTRTADGRSILDRVRKLVTSIDPSLPLISPKPLTDAIALGLVPQRIAASVSGTLGGIGMLLAAVGIYGVTAFAVSRRTREFGIRLALGARPADLLRMVLRHGLGLTAIGCTIGLILGALVSVVLAGFFFGVPPIDPVTFTAAATLFALVGAAACYGPARRATRTDPLIALRHE